MFFLGGLPDCPPFTTVSKIENTKKSPESQGRIFPRFVCGYIYFSKTKVPFHCVSVVKDKALTSASSRPKAAPAD